MSNGFRQDNREAFRLINQAVALEFSVWEVVPARNKFAELSVKFRLDVAVRANCSV